VNSQTSKLTDSQLEALRLMYVHCRHGKVRCVSSKTEIAFERVINLHTAWALENKGLVKTGEWEWTAHLGHVKLTPFGRQVGKALANARP
jgi:hypothetical protein